MWLLWLLLIPVALVAIVVMVILGLVALFVGLVKAAPILLVLVGGWLLVRALLGPSHGRADGRYGPRGPRHHRRHDPRRAPAPAPVPTMQRVQPLAPKPAPAPKRELPIDVQVKVEQIRRKANMLLGYADRFPPLSQDLYIVRQTAAEYLPHTIDTYLALPGTDDPVVTRTGKTALEELREQLHLLDTKLDEIAQDLQRKDVDRLLANRQFLEDRFRPQPPDPMPQPSGTATDAA
jgi:hypothetical protein